MKIPDLENPEKSGNLLNEKSGTSADNRKWSKTTCYLETMNVNQMRPK